MSEIEKLKIQAKLLQKAKQRAGIPFRLKEAFDLLARRAGFGSWRDLRKSVDGGADFCPRGSSAFWQAWYATLAEARAQLADRGGFLLPYRRHYFVCEPVYLEFLGLSLADPDLAAVGNDWSVPQDREAYARLLAKIRAKDQVG